MTDKEARKYLEISRKMLDTEKETSAIVLEKQSLDVAIKAVRIVEVIESGFGRDSNLMMDADDWKDIKALVEKEAE